MTSVVDFVSAENLFKSIKGNDRVFILVRHGERNHITPNDPDYGAHVGLTDNGRKQALGFGSVMPIDGDAVYFSSPVGRCVETAECIAKGRADQGYPQTESVTPIQELAEYFVSNYDEYLKVLKAGFYEGLCEYVEKGSHPAFYPVKERVEEMLRMMQVRGSAKFNIFVTHDAWIVPCLRILCGLKFTPQRWMNFLSGFAMILSADGNRKFIPITALPSGYLEF